MLVGRLSAHVNQVTPAPSALAQWLNTLLHHPPLGPSPAHRLVTLCSGALLAASAGLLRNRRCTTHADLVDNLRLLARAQVVDNCVFAVDGQVASGAGVTAGIDLALHLIATECGEVLAAGIAESMVVSLRRSSGDPELSPLLGHRRHMHMAVHQVQDALSAEPERDRTMAALAGIGRVTERHLLRLFMDHAGALPMHGLQTIPLERARQSLEHGAARQRRAAPCIGHLLQHDRRG